MSLRTTLLIISGGLTVCFLGTAFTLIALMYMGVW